MIVENSIRRTIYRDELHYVLEVHKNNLTKYDRQNITKSLFDNSLEASKQLYLKEEIKKIHQIKDVLSAVISDVKIVGMILSLFLVDEDLRIPPDIEKLFLKNEKIAVFVGAGVSKLIGIPLWSDLAFKAIEYLLNENIISYFEYKKIQNEVISPKQKMTIFHDFLPKTSYKAIQFYKDKMGMDNMNNEVINPYDLLVDFDWIKITSNIDSGFFMSLDRAALEYKRNIDLEELMKIPQQKTNRILGDFNEKTPVDSDTIYQIHGSLDNIPETVMTTRDYIEAYYREKSGLSSFLSKIFSEYNVIFVGYALEEFEVMERVLAATKDKTKRYVLYPTYLNEMNYFRAMKKYFENLDIEPIAYYLDFNGFKRLNDVLSSWLKHIVSKQGKGYYKNIHDIDEAL